MPSPLQSAVAQPLQTQAETPRPQNIGVYKNRSAIVEQMYDTPGLSVRKQPEKNPPCQHGAVYGQSHVLHKSLLERITRIYDNHPRQQAGKRVQRLLNKHISQVAGLYNGQTPGRQLTTLLQLTRLGELVKNQASWLKENGHEQLADIASQLARQYSARGISLSAPPPRSLRSRITTWTMAGLSLLGLGTTARANPAPAAKSAGSGSGSGQDLACHVPVYVQPLPEPYPTCGEFRLNIAVRGSPYLIVSVLDANGVHKNEVAIAHIVRGTYYFRNLDNLIALRRTPSADEIFSGPDACLKAEVIVKVSSKFNGFQITVSNNNRPHTDVVMTLPVLRNDSRVMDLIVKAINCRLMNVKWADNNEDSIEWRVKNGCENFTTNRKETTIARIVNRNQSIEVTPVTCHDSEGNTTTTEFLESNFPPCPEGIILPTICQDIVPPTPSMLTRTVTETTTTACSAPPWQSATALLPTAAVATTTTLTSLFIALGVVASTVAVLLCGSLIAGAWYKHSRTQNFQRRRASAGAEVALYDHNNTTAQHVD